jgi:hypothetical protein
VSLPKRRKVEVSEFSYSPSIYVEGASSGLALVWQRHAYSGRGIDASVPVAQASRWHMNTRARLDSNGADRDDGSVDSGTSVARPCDDSGTRDNGGIMNQ